MSESIHRLDAQSVAEGRHPAAARSARPHAFLLSTLLSVSLAFVIGSRLASNPSTPSSMTSLSAAEITSVEATADYLDIGSAGAAQYQALVLTLQGARADFIETYISDGTMRSLALLATKGMVTEFVRGVDPPSPVVSHVSLACGSRPRTTGIVGELFRSIGQPLEPPLDAAAGIDWQAPPLWEWTLASTAPKRPSSAVLFWPGGWGSAVEAADIVVHLWAPPAADGAGTRASEVRTRPMALADEIHDQIGEPPTVPDVADVRAGALRPADYLASIERQLRWKLEVIGYIQDQYHPQILFASLDSLWLGSEWALSDSGDGIYDPVMRQLYRTADRAVGYLLTDIDLSTTTVLVGSPHGYASASVATNLEAILGGLAPREGGTALRAYSSGGAAHIVANVAGRELGGIVPPARLSTLLEEARGRLTSLELEGRPVIERTLSGTQLWQLGLDARDAGDLFVQARPGYLLADQDPTGEGRLSWDVSAAVAGYAATTASMRGCFVLAGHRIPARGFVGPIELVDVVPTLGAILNLNAPASVDGRPLYELLTP